MISLWYLLKIRLWGWWNKTIDDIFIVTYFTPRIFFGFFFASGSLTNHSPVYCLTNIWISISVIACAIYWPDWIIQIRIKLKRLYTRFILYAEMVPGGAFSCEWTQGCFFTLHNLIQSVFMVSFWVDEIKISHTLVNLVLDSRWGLCINDAKPSYYF